MERGGPLANTAPDGAGKPTPEIDVTETTDIHDPAFVASVFDRYAVNYRWWAAVSSFGFVSRWRRQCVQLLPDPVDHPVAVDLMAGTGEIWPIFLARFPRTQKIIAIDISHQMHRYAVEQLHRDRADRIEHIEADALASVLPENIADCVISSFGLKTLSHPQQAQLAQELARILKPGGTFSLVEASDPKGWVLRPLYRFYMDRVIPLVERFAMRGAQDFSMVGIYTRTFLNCGYFAQCLRDQGLEVQDQRFFFGTATGVTGRKA